MPAIEFTVYGKPAPAGSKRGFPIKGKGDKVRVIVTDANPRTKPWQALVKDAAWEAYDGPVLQGPLDVTMTFWQPRPKWHYGTGRNAGVVKATAPAAPTGKPDVLKLARGVEDGLTGVLYRDDSQIVTEHLYKCYGERPGVHVRIVEV